MKVSHKMDQRQVEEVLTQFEATTTAIRGIDEKVARVDGYVAKMHTQREKITKQMETVAGLVDRMSDTLNSRSDDILMFFTDTLDNFAGLVEKLEQRLLDLRLQDAPRQIQREFGPLLMPAVVLVVIITVSNCIFGFLLAADSNLADSFSILQHESIKDENPINILKVFAVLHVALIGAAVLFLVIEGCRTVRKKVIPKTARSGEGRHHHHAADEGICDHPSDSPLPPEDARTSRPSLGRRPTPDSDQPLRRSFSQVSVVGQPSHGRTTGSDVAADVRQRVAELRLRRRNSDPYVYEANALPFATRLRSEGWSPAETNGAGLGFAARFSGVSCPAQLRGHPWPLEGASSDEALNTLERRSPPSAGEAPRTPERQISTTSDQASEPRQEGQADARDRLRRLELPPAQPQPPPSPSEDERVAARSPAPEPPASRSPAESHKGSSGSREAATRSRTAPKQGLGGILGFLSPGEPGDAGGGAAPRGGTTRTPLASVLRRLQKAASPLTDRVKGGAEPSDGTPRRRFSADAEEATGSEPASRTHSPRRPRTAAEATETSPGGRQVRSPGGESASASASSGSPQR